MADIAQLSSPAGFSQLVQQLLSAENEPRKHAEALFEQLKQHPDACAGNLLAVVRSSPDVEHRSFAAIMLRKVGSLAIWADPCRQRFSAKLLADSRN